MDPDVETTAQRSPHERPGRLGVGVIGVGRAGAAMAGALRAAGHQLVGVHAVSATSRERAEVLLPGVPVLDVQPLVERSELVLLAVPDDALPDLIQGLATVGAWHPGQLVVHPSRVHGLEALAPATAAGAIPLVVTPVLALTGFSMDTHRLTDAAFAVTAPEPVLPIAQALAVEMGGEPVIVACDRRRLFFAAVAHLSDSLTTLVAQSERVLEDVGVERPDRVVGPLLRAAVDDVVAVGEDALLGPVARGEASTVAAYRAALAQHAQATGSVHLLATYLTMARGAADLAAQRGLLTAEQLTALLDSLSQ